MGTQFTESSPQVFKTRIPPKNLREDYQENDMSRYAITIGLDPGAVYEFFRDFRNLSLFMKDIKEVQVLTPRTSHWVVELKSGLKVEWDAEITGESVGEMIAWRSLEGSEVKTSGSVWFTRAPEDLGCVVSLEMDYKVPGGKLTELITKMTGEDPDSLAQINLRRLKVFLETGEIPTTEGQSSGRQEAAEEIVKH